jgi:hypothetical protein
MRKLTIAALAATSLAVGATPASADTGAVPPPPLDPVHIEGGGNCGGEACTPRPYSVEVDKTYPSRVVAWVRNDVIGI